MSIVASKSELTQLREEMDEQSAAFETAPAGLVVAWAVDRFGPKLTLACSFQDAVLIDIAVKVDPTIEVVFLDTGSHFPETLEYVETIRQRYDLNLTVTKPAAGAEAWPCGTAQCCEFRKVRPMKQALEGKEAWITGLKRVDAPTRRDAPIVSYDDNWGMVKINPLATWTEQDIAGYGADHGIPRHPLLSQGYLSIGCAPTTRPVKSARIPVPAAGPTRTRSSADCTSEMTAPLRAPEMTKDRDELYGLNIRGTERPMPFVNPYRTQGELNEIEQWKLERHPLEVADAIIDTYSKEGPAAIAKVPGRGGAPQVGRASTRRSRAATPS